MKEYDLIVLGGGSAGLPPALRAGNAGWQTALVEYSRLGGTCVNVGCIPSKALISSARVMQTVRSARKLGVIAGVPRADWPAMVQRKEELIGRISDRSYRNVQKNENVHLYEDKAAFTAPQTLEVGGETITAKKIVIATGARSALPPVPGLADIPYLTSTSAMELKELPGSLLVLGGGIIALEFSQLFARLGVAVTVIQRGPRLAPNLEPEISEEIRTVLEEEGVSVKTGTSIRSAGVEGSSVYLEDETPEGVVRYRGDQLLVATGRTPNSDLLHLDRAGVETDERGYILVDEGFQTSAEGVWAIGDAIGGMMFTHKAWHDGLLLSSFLLGGEEVVSTNRLIPFAIFTDPEIAGVGMSEAGAREAGYRVKVQRFPFANHGRALAAEQLNGFIKLVVDAGDGKILGAHIIGPAAGESIHELIAAMRFGADVRDLQQMMHVHPTITEAINSAAWSG